MRLALFLMACFFLIWRGRAFVRFRLLRDGLVAVFWLGFILYMISRNGLLAVLLGCGEGCLVLAFSKSPTASPLKQTNEKPVADRNDLTESEDPVEETDDLEARKEEEEEADEKKERLESNGFPLRKAVEIRFKVCEKTQVTLDSGERIWLPMGEIAGELSISTTHRVAPPEDLAFTALRYKLKLHSSEVPGVVIGQFTGPWTPGNDTNEGVYHDWEQAPSAWRSSFQERCLAVSVPCMSDSRERYSFRIDDTPHTIMSKYLGWDLDIAVGEERRSLILRIRGLCSEVWSTEFGDPDEDEDEPAFLDIKRLRVFAAEFPLTRFLDFSPIAEDEE